MATSWPSSGKENLNFARLSKLLIDGGTRALRDVFDSIHLPSSLHRTLLSTAVHSTLKGLRAKRILNNQQWDRLYPTSRSTAVTSADFDITLLFVLLRNICGLTPPPTGWDKPPVATDLSREADLARVKYYRNELYGHITETAVSDSDFEKYWSEISDVLVRLGGPHYKPKIERMKIDTMDPEQEKNSIGAIKEWEEMEQTILQKMEEILAKRAKRSSADASQAKEYTEKLKSFIKQQTDFLLSEEEDKKIRTDDIFTSVTIQRGPKHFEEPQEKRFGRRQLDEIQASSTKLTNCSEMFLCPENDDQKSTASCTTNPKSILLTGKAGIGKSLFCRKLVRDWSHNRLFEEGQENAKVPDFQFVFLLTFRQLVLPKEKRLDLRDILSQSSLLNEHSVIDEPLLQYMIENPEKLLIILDGYDEYKQRKKITEDFETRYSNDPHQKMPVPALITKIMKGKMLNGAVVLISSRPGEAEELKKIVFDVRCDIQGFSSLQVLEYIEKYFKDNESMKNKALDHIKTNEILLSLGHIPVMCFLMCYCIKWYMTESKTTEKLPVTRTELYHQVIILFIKKHSSSKYEEMEETKVQEILHKLAALAVNLMMKHKYIFDENDMKRFNLNDEEITNLKASGLLDCCPGVKKSPSEKPPLEFTFTHLTIQEFLCAFFFVEKKQIPEKEKTSDVTFMFMAGMCSREKDEKMMEKLIENIKPEDEYDERNKLTTLSCLDENKDDGQETEADAEAEAETTAPPEILASSPEALEAYKEALMRGKTKNRRVLVTVVGPPRAGKTSLLKSLKGEDFDPNEDSTTGVVLQNSWFEEVDGEDNFVMSRIAECTVEILKNNQTREGKDPEDEEQEFGDSNSGEDFDPNEDSTTGVVLQNSRFEEVDVKDDFSMIRSDECMAEKLKNNQTRERKAVAEREHPSQKDPEDEEQEFEDSVMENTTLQPSNLIDGSKVPKEMVPLLYKRLRDTKNDQRANENEISLKTLDFAGQQVYEVILPLFISSKSIYILVHSLENGLRSDAQPKVKHGNSERKLKNSFKMTNLDGQEFWLSCISSYTNLKKEVDSVDYRTQVALPPVFVVCTHADVCNQDPKEVARELGEVLTRPENAYSKHVVPDVYTVDNTLSGNKEKPDKSAQRLKTDVEELSKLLPQVNEDIPVSWLRFEEELSRLVEKEQKKYVDLEEAMRIATQCNVNTATESIEFTTLLNYLHDLKTIIYFEETRTVFIDTQWLVDMFVKVITVMPFEEWKEYAAYWRKLENDGILKRALVEYVWSDIASDGQNTVDSLLLIMEKFSLICPWRLKEEQVYLVPCMLCNSKGTEDIEKLLANQKSSTMVIRFKSVHLPMGIFPRLLVALAEHGKKEWPKVSQGKKECLPKLRPNFCRMYNVGQEGKLDICLTSGVRTICVTVYNKKNIDGASVTKFCQSVRKLLDEIFAAMENTCPQVENMELEYGVRCPVCTKSECSSQETRGCKRDSCQHFVREEELKLGGAECYEDDTNPDTLIREETYSHWFPKTITCDEADNLDATNQENGASGNASCLELVACLPGLQELATIIPTTAADKLAEYLGLDKLSMANPTDEIQQKCRTFCRHLKKMGRHDIIKELRKTLPSGMTGPILDDDILYQELDFKTKEGLTKSLCGNDRWKHLASALEVPGDHIGFYERQNNPAFAMLEEKGNGLKVVELYDILVKCDADALADNYL